MSYRSTTTQTRRTAAQSHTQCVLNPSVLFVHVFTRCLCDWLEGSNMLASNPAVELDIWQRFRSGGGDGLAR